MKLLRNIKIMPRLIASFLIVAILAGIVGTIGIVSLYNTKNDYSVIYGDYGVAQGLIGKIAINFHIVRTTTRDMILESDPAKQAEYEKVISDTTELNNKLMPEFKATIHTDSTMAQFTKLEENLAAYRDIRDKIISLAVENKKDEALALLRGAALAPTKATDQSIQELFETKATNGATKDRIPA